MSRPPEVPQINIIPGETASASAAPAKLQIGLGASRPKKKPPFAFSFAPKTMPSKDPALQAVLDSLEKDPARKGEMDNLKRVFGSDISDELLYMYDTTIKTYFTKANGEIMPFEISKKGIGINSGFVISNPDGTGKKFVKSFLDSGIAGKPSCAELFSYILLQKLNFGPEINALTCVGKFPFLVSRDLSAQGKLYIGKDAMGLVSQNLWNQDLKTKIIASEILAKILRFGDVRTNEGNFGLLEKAVDGKPYPIILDFHFDPSFESHPLTPKSTGITFLKMREAFSPSRTTPHAAVGLTRTFRSCNLEKAVYDSAIEICAPKNIEEILQATQAECEEFFAKLDAPERMKFKPEYLQEYLAEVRKHYAVIQQGNSFDTILDEPVRIMDGLSPQILSLANSAASSRAPSMLSSNLGGQLPTQASRTSSEAKPVHSSESSEDPFVEGKIILLHDASASKLDAKTASIDPKIL